MSERDKSRVFARLIEKKVGRKLTREEKAYLFIYL